jgi:hypothetical protein
MNLCFYFLFLSSFYTYEDGVVQEEDAKFGIGAPGADRGGSSGSCVSGHIYLYYNTSLNI